MNDFTKEELEWLYHELMIIVNRYEHTHKMSKPIAVKLQSMINSYCDHEWCCWDDEHNTRECMKCSERQEGAI